MCRFHRRAYSKGIALRVVDSLTGNYHKDDFTPLETMRRFLGVIGSISQSSSEGRPWIRSKGYVISRHLNRQLVQTRNPFDTRGLYEWSCLGTPCKSTSSSGVMAIGVSIIDGLEDLERTYLSHY
ncbi:hypothetical protein Tco_1448041 [Tanacetum coccineum]